MISRESPLILYNAATGGLGRHMAGAATAAGLPSRAIAARLEDEEALATELESLGKPPVVNFIHLAARVSVPICEADPIGTHEINVVSAARVLDRVANWASKLGVPLRVVYVSTGHVYAPPDVGSRVNEDAPTSPRSVYARSKLEAEAVFRDRAARLDFPLVIARVFGLIAPGQPPNYVLPGLIARVREQRLDGIPGLDMVRDYLDGRDVCRDLVALSRSPVVANPIVNVCSGEPTTIRDLLAAVLLASGREDGSSFAATIKAAPGRADDVRWLVGDPARFVLLTGIQPRSIPLEWTVRDAVSAAP